MTILKTALMASLILAVPLYAQKAPVEMRFEVSSTTRLRLQSVPIKVEIKPTKSIPFVALSSSAAENVGSPSTVTATNLKAKQVTRVTERLLLTPSDIGFLTIGLSGEKSEEFSVPDTVDIPVSNTGPTLNLGTPVSSVANGNTISSKLKVIAAPVDVASEVDGYRSVAMLSVDIRKSGFKVSSKQLDHVVSTVTTEGGISIVSAESLTRRLPPSPGPVVNKLPFAIAIGERGTITSQVVAKDAKGKILFGRKAVLYVLSDERKLYTGTGSFVDLEIRKLQDDREAGSITPDQYRQRLALLLAGKASESN